MITIDDVRRICEALSGADETRELIEASFRLRAPTKLVAELVG